MFLELPEKNPFNSIIEPSLKSMANVSWSPWTNSCTCLFKILIGTNVNCFKFSLIKNKWSMLLEPLGLIPLHSIESVLIVPGKGSCSFLSQAPLLNPHWDSVEHRWNTFLELSVVIPVCFSIQSLLTVNAKCSWSSMGQPLYNSVLNMF